MDIVYLVSGVLAGGIISWLIFHFYTKSKNPFTKNEFENIRNEKSDLEVRLQVMQGKLGSQEEECDVLRADLHESRENAVKFSNALAAREVEIENLNGKLTEQRNDIEELQEKFQIQFKNLANDILDEKTKKFTDQNKTNLSDILNPLKEKIVEFEKKVEQSNKESIERNSALKEQITGLKELNQQITKEAENLTRALKGEIQITR